MKNQAQEAQQQKPGREGQIDGIFPKQKEHTVLSKTAHSHPPIHIP